MAPLPRTAVLNIGDDARSRCVSHGDVYPVPRNVEWRRSVVNSSDLSRRSSSDPYESETCWPARLFQLLVAPATRNQNTYRHLDGRWRATRLRQLSLKEDVGDGEPAN